MDTTPIAFKESFHYADQLIAVESDLDHNMTI